MEMRRLKMPTKCPECRADNDKAILDKEGVCPVCGLRVFPTNNMRDKIRAKIDEYKVYMPHSTGAQTGGSAVHDALTSDILSIIEKAIPKKRKKDLSDVSHAWSFDDGYNQALEDVEANLKKEV